MTVVLPNKVESDHVTSQNLINKSRRLGFGVTSIAIPQSKVYANATGVESKDGEGWQIPPGYVWTMNRTKRVREKALIMDAAFKEMFPEASENDSEVILKLVSPKKKNNNQSLEENERKVA